MIFSTDDFWCLDMMKKNSSRMRVLSVYDLKADETVGALRHLRRQALRLRQPNVPLNEIEIEDDLTLRKVHDLVGGRMSHLTQVARAENMMGTRQHGIADSRRGRVHGTRGAELATSQDRSDTGAR